MLITYLIFYHQMLTDSTAQEDQQCNAAKLLEVAILQCQGRIDEVE